MKDIIAISLLCLALAGCSHQLTLMSQTSGAQGTGTAIQRGSGGGDLTIQLAGKTYKGTWIKETAGSFGFLSGASGMHSFSASSFAVGGTTGNALLHASDGSGLRCEFSYSSMSRGGYGVCRDDAGVNYDLQIR